MKIPPNKNSLHKLKHQIVPLQKFPSTLLSRPRKNVTRHPNSRAENHPNGASRVKRGFPSPQMKGNALRLTPPSLLMATVSSHPVFGIHLADANAIPFILGKAFARIKGDISLCKKRVIFFLGNQRKGRAISNYSAIVLKQKSPVPRADLSSKNHPQNCLDYKIYVWNSATFRCRPDGF